MPIFNRRGPDRQDDRSTTAGNQPSSQYERSGPGPQNQGPGVTQYEGTGSDPRYQGGGTDPRYQGEGTDPRYQGEGTDPRYERAGTTYQVARAPQGLPDGWIGELLLGLATLVIGLIVAFHPIHTLNALAILLGVLMIVSGVYHVIRSLRRTGDHRMWGGIAGVLFFLVGIFLLRHVGLTLALMALFAGFAFVIAGIAMLAEAVTGHGALGRGWSALFGVILVFAGIAAITTPIGSLARLAIVLGWAFAAFGIMHIIGAFVSRRHLREEARAGQQVTIPGQRGEPMDREAAYGESSTTQAGASSGEPRHRRSRL